jgi:hypothetical protein
VRSVDVSYNALKSLSFLKAFPLLESVVADSNALTVLQGLPVMPSVTTVSLNDNEIDNLELLVAAIREAFPNVTYLSLLKYASTVSSGFCFVVLIFCLFRVPPFFALGLSFLSCFHKRILVVPIFLWARISRTMLAIVCLC